MINAPLSKEKGYRDVAKQGKRNGSLTFLYGAKANLSIEEAAAYSGIGMAKLYEMTESEDCPFVLWIGSRRMIKRKSF